MGRHAVPTYRLAHTEVPIPQYRSRIGSGTGTGVLRESDRVRREDDGRVPVRPQIEDGRAFEVPIRMLRRRHRGCRGLPRHFVLYDMLAAVQRGAGKT